MKIRDIDIDPALILAPMEGVTDLTFRRLIRQIGGCGLTVTEFIPANGLTHDAPKCLRMAQFDEDESPVAIQIYGRDPELMGEAARYVADLGPDIIDLNMGCPSKRVCQRSGGSALMKEPELARSIIASMRAATELPFTVKMRAGWDPENKNAPEIAQMCEEEGVEAVTVHWRTRADGYGGERELDTIAQVVDRVSIPVIANGDILDVDSARDTLRRTGADGLMIGRGAIRNPWVFEQIRRDQLGLAPLHVSLDERERVLLAYYDALRTTFRSDKGALGRMKKIARYFTAGLPDGAILRQAIFHSQTIPEATTRIREYFARHREAAAGGATHRGAALPVESNRPFVA